MIVGLTWLIGSPLDAKPILTIWLIVEFIVTNWMIYALVFKRFHDLDRTGAWILVALVPFVGFVWVLGYCGFFPGSQGRNRCGQPV